MDGVHLMEMDSCHIFNDLYKVVILCNFYGISDLVGFITLSAGCLNKGINKALILTYSLI